VTIIQTFSSLSRGREQRQTDLCPHGLKAEKGGKRSAAQENAFTSPLKNGLARHRDVVPSFAGSERARKFVRLAKAPLANSPLQKPGTAFATSCYRMARTASVASWTSWFGASPRAMMITTRATLTSLVMPSTATAGRSSPLPV